MERGVTWCDERCPRGAGLKWERWPTPLLWLLCVSASVSCRSASFAQPAGSSHEESSTFQEPPVPELAGSRALPALGRIAFPWSVPSIQPETSRPPDEHRHRAAHRVAVDRQGRIWISELSTRRVHVFDSEGRELFERRPDAEHYRPYRPADWMTVRDDGTLFLCGDGAIESFEPSGERGPRIETGEYLAPRWWFLPTSSRWVIGSAKRIDLIDLE